jgi:hypothetical protein
METGAWRETIQAQIMPVMMLSLLGGMVHQQLAQVCCEQGWGATGLPLLIIANAWGYALKQCQISCHITCILYCIGFPMGSHSTYICKVGDCTWTDVVPCRS